MKKAVQIHIPKTGGMTIRMFLSALVGETPMGYAYHPRLRDRRLKMLVNKIKKDGDEPYYFAFVREPLSRVCSSFAFVIDNELRKEHPNSKPPFWNDKDVRKLLLMKDDQAGPPTEEQFLRAFSTTRHRLFKLLPKLRMMFYQQRRWISGPDSKQIHLYDFGDFANEVERLRLDLGYPLPPPGIELRHTHKTGRSDKKIGESLSRYTHDKITRMLEPDYLLYARMLREKEVRLAEMRAK